MMFQQYSHTFRSHSNSDLATIFSKYYDTGFDAYERGRNVKTEIIRKREAWKVYLAKISFIHFRRLEAVWNCTKGDDLAPGKRLNISRHAIPCGLLQGLFNISKVSVTWQDHIE